MLNRLNTMKTYNVGKDAFFVMQKPSHEYRL